MIRNRDSGHSLIVKKRMGDLIAFGGYVNSTTPFSWNEYDPIWKSDRRYHDFQPGSEQNLSCQYPRMWAQDGLPLTQNILSQMHGCRDSEFDLVSSFAQHPTTSVKCVRSTEISKGQEHIQATSINCPSLLLYRIDLGNGDQTFWKRSKSCPACKSPCWTSMAFGQ